MLQKVKNIPYLAECVIDLTSLVKGEEKEALIIPQGASVIDLKLEVFDYTGKSTIDIKADEVEFFSSLSLNSNDVATKYHTSLVHSAFSKNTTLNIKANAAFSTGSLKLKMLYFNPSEINFEV